MPRPNYTPEAIAESARYLPESVREDIIGNLKGYLVEFTGATEEEATAIAERICPVVVALIDDGMHSGRVATEQYFAEQINLAKAKIGMGGSTLGHRRSMN